MKKYFAAAVLGCTVAFAGCQSQPETPINPTAQKDVYNGMLPCGDCSGIRTTLTLYRDQYNNPTRFELREEYMSGSTVKLNTVERGDWTSQKYREGVTQEDVYTINPEQDESQRKYLKDAVNAIEQLNQSGYRIDSNLNYRLLSK
ncbi:copper resistance protein NlpE N-terminal domain-containing protein [Alcanivorax sp.]|jgi:copper homeostasis protein (lipoprotein)|uniref:copper resistance protein NlpE N-terminal domain-containing protein n=1 Tax=Alcanivorax sp. TaxID=1872427 RepID=UPI0032D8D884